MASSLIWTLPCLLMMTMNDPVEVWINGWTLLFHPCFDDQYQELINRVIKVQARRPSDWQNHHHTKLLKAINQLVFKKIPLDPSNPAFRQGDTLGAGRRHWFRAKFFQQYRLFFRFHTQTRFIVFAWVNDDTSLRAYDSNSDAYGIFQAMLDRGYPPDDWDALVKACRPPQRSLD